MIGECFGIDPVDKVLAEPNPVHRAIRAAAFMAVQTRRREADKG